MTINKLNYKPTAYKLYTLLVAFLMSGCTETITKEEKNQRISRKFETIEIDGCEYLYREGYRMGLLAHKANCKNH